MAAADEFLILDVAKFEHGLQVQKLGTIFEILVRSKTKPKKRVTIEPTPAKSWIYEAVFDEDGVDFVIHIDNRRSPERDVNVTLTLHGKEHNIMVPRGKRARLETVGESREKFHFIKQAGEEGSDYLENYARKHKISKAQASASLQEIEFHVQYSPATFQIVVKAFISQAYSSVDTCFTLELNKYDTLELIEDKIEEATGLEAKFQVLLFPDGRKLKDMNPLEGFNLSANSVIHLKDSRDFLSLEGLATGQQSTVTCPGAVVGNCKSKQKHKPATFLPDPMVLVQDFILHCTYKKKLSYGFF